MDRDALKKYVINVSYTIKETINFLEETREKNIYVLDLNGKLVGSISDGDIRRGMLRNVDINSSVKLIMNNNPKYLLENDIINKNKVKSIFEKYKVLSLPVVKDMIIKDIVFWNEVFYNKIIHKKDNKVFILAGGLGSRLEPFTKILPKPLIPLGDKPIIERIMDKFKDNGYDNFILSLNYKADIIKLYLNDVAVKDKYESIKYVEETEPLGTIGSLYFAKEYISESFFITNSDIMIKEDLEKLMNFHKQSNASLTVVGCIKNSIIPYGVLNIDDDGFLINMEEKPSYSHIINTGVYIAEPEIISLIEGNVKQDITELICKLLKLNKKISVFPIKDDQWFDVGQWEEYERTKLYFS